MTNADDALDPLAQFLATLDKRSGDNAAAIQALQQDTTAAAADIRAAVAALDQRIQVLESEHTDKPGPVPPAQRTVGMTEPTAANTGLSGSPGGPRTKMTGDLVCQSGKTYEDIDVDKGHVILAPGCTVRRVTATGRLSGGTYYSGIFFGSNAEGALVEDCVARPSAATARVSLNGFGWSGKGYTARWNDISGVTDLFHGTGDGMKIHANYCHDYRFDPVDPDQSGGWCHPDFVQCLGGADLEIWGNSSWMNYDPVLSVGVDKLFANAWYTKAWGGGYGNGVTLTFSANIKRWKMIQNWLRGGEVGLQLPIRGRGFDTGNDGEIWGNRVFVSTANAWHSSAQRHHFRQDTGTGLVTTDVNKPNIDMETGLVLPGPYQPKMSIRTNV